MSDYSFPDSIDKVFYINLDRRPDRNSHMNLEFDRVNIPKTKVERFRAIDGDHLFDYGVNVDDIIKFKKSDFIKKRNKNYLIGNQLSHMRILNKIVEENLDNVLIMQDDIKFIDNFNEEIDKVIKTMPEDTEIVWIGFHKSASGKHVLGWDLEKQTANGNDYYHKIHNEHIAQCKTSTNPCSTAYIITNKGARNFIDHVRDVGFLRATDGNFNDYLRSKNIDYCSRLVLCTGIMEFGSDIF